MPRRIPDPGEVINNYLLQLEIIILREVSQKEKDKYQMISLICGILHMTNEAMHETAVESWI